MRKIFYIIDGLERMRQNPEYADVYNSIIAEIEETKQAESEWYGKAVNTKGYINKLCIDAIHKMDMQEAFKSAIPKER